MTLEADGSLTYTPDAHFNGTDTIGYIVSDGTLMITLWQAADPSTAVAFDRKNVIGLHHLALRVENAAALDALHTTLQGTENVEIEFAPEDLGNGPVRHMMTTIPGGVRVEFIAV